jgi:hypothetical protein
VRCRENELMGRRSILFLFCINSKETVAVKVGNVFVSSKENCLFKLKASNKYLLSRKYVFVSNACRIFKTFFCSNEDIFFFIVPTIRRLVVPEFLSYNVRINSEGSPEKKIDCKRENIRITLYLFSRVGRPTVMS